MNDDDRRDMTETMEKLNTDIERTRESLDKVIDQISRKRMMAASVVHRIIASKDIMELYEDTLDEFESGKKKQRWEVVPRNKIIKIWRSFSKTGEVTSEEIFEIYEQTVDNLKQVIVN